MTHEVYGGQFLTREELRQEYDTRSNMLSTMQPFEHYINWRRTHPAERIVEVPASARQSPIVSFFKKLFHL